MGDILPFIQKVRSNGEWTAAERARLEELAERFAAAGVKVEVVYGVSEDGDPWCVVKDANEEVLVHVARIGGAFVVHSAIDDALREGQDLRSALGERLSWAEPDDGRVVVPFGRQAQTLLALIVATAFFYDTAAVTAPEAAHHAALPEPDAHVQPAVTEALPPTDKRELAQHASVLGTTDDPAPKAADTGHAASDAPLPQAFAARNAAEEPLPAPVHAATAAPAPAAPAVQLAQAETRGVQLTGTAGADHLVGTSGDDTLSGGGAPKGGHDLIEGGAGNDKIFLGAQVVAVGGEGADSFVVVAPAQADHPDTLLGVVLDFHAIEGDRLITVQGKVLTLAPSTTAPPVTVSVDGDGADKTFFTGQRVDVDLDGDGKPDGYVVVSNQGHDDASAVTAVGQALSHPDPFG